MCEVVKSPKHFLGLQMQKVGKILLVGLGSIGQRHLRNIQKAFPQTICVAHSTKKKPPFGDCELFTSIEKAIQSNPQVAIVCNPSSKHLEVAKQLVDAGIHVLLEKPMSDSLDGISSFIKNAKEKKVRVMVAYNLRFRKSLECLWTLIKEERFGEVFSVSAEVGQYLPDWREGVDYRDSVSSKACLGGGALLELSHELDYLVWFFHTPTRVFGNLMKLSRLEIDVEDYVSAEIWFNFNGREIPCSVHLDFLQVKAKRECRIVCSNGTLVWDATEDSVVLHQNKNTELLFQGTKDTNESYVDELISFINSVTSETPPRISLEESARVMKIIQAIRNSSASGSVVTL